MNVINIYIYFNRILHALRVYWSVDKGVIWCVSLRKNLFTPYEAKRQL